MEIWNSPNVVLPRVGLLVLCYTPNEPINHFIVGAYDDEAEVFVDNDDYGFWPECWISIPEPPIVVNNI